MACRILACSSDRVRSKKSRFHGGERDELHDVVGTMSQRAGSIVVVAALFDAYGFCD